MRQFESVSQPPRAKRGTGSASADLFLRGRPPKRQKRQPRPSVRNDGPSSTNLTGQNRTSPRAKRNVQREGYLGLDAINEMIDSTGALDPALDVLGFPQQASPAGALTITVRAPQPDTVDAAAHPDEPVPCPNDQEGSGSSAVHGLSPPSPQLRQGDENGGGQDQAHVQAAHATPTSSNAGHLKDRGREDEEPKRPAVHPSPSPTPGLAAGSGSGAKFSVNFTYRVVLSRTPKTVTERWTPRGRFQDKTLAELVGELPFCDGEAQGLIFTIESSCMKTVERIPLGDEDGFATMKRYINMEIREWLARQRRLGAQTTPRLVVDILIERMSDEKKQELLDGLEDLELEW